MRSNKYYISIF